MNMTWHGPVIAVLLMILPQSLPAVADGTERQLLILNSYHKGYEWTDRQVEGIEEVLSATGNVRLRVEYMDTGLIAEANHHDILVAHYREKYADIDIAAIIAVDDPALHFLGLHQESLFPGARVVHSGIKHGDESGMPNAPANLTGIDDRTDFATNIELVLDLYPAVGRIHVIADSTPDAELLVTELLQAATVYRDRVEFEFLTGLRADELIASVAELPLDSAVLYLGFFRDSAGQEFDPGEIIPRISEASPVPVFGTVDYMMGYGIAGGYLKSAFSMGKVAGRLAQQLLADSAPEQLPQAVGSSESIHDYMFDFRQLVRFDLPFHRLPAGSTVIEEPDTFYYRYRKLLWPVIGIFGLMLIYIAVLLFNIRKRKKAQRGLRNILGQTSRLYQLDSLEQFGRDLQTRLAAVVPLRSAPLLFKYAGPVGQGQFDGQRLFPILQPSQPEPNSAPSSARAQLQQAVENARSSFANRCAAIFFDNPDMPANLALVRTRNRMDDIDRRLLDIFASNVAVSIDNIGKYKLLEALQTARQIQESMLPGNFTDFAGPYGVDIYARLLPAREVSGDLYDFFALDEDRLCVLVGDVSDKGMPAALFMAATRTLIRSVAEIRTDPAGLLEKVNRGLCRNNDLSMFVTLFLAIFDRRSGELVYVNGGHNPPFLLHQGEVDTVATEPGIALGVLESMIFSCRTLPLPPGAALFIYSDGITEALNSDNEQFGEARLQQVLTDSVGQSSETIVRQVLASTESFVEGAPRSDDMTLLCLRRV